MGILKFIKACFKPRWIYRDAESGEFVTEAHAKANPSTTIRQRILFPRGGHHR